jgi:hemerythrin-like domain-containing protein
MTAPDLPRAASPAPARDGFDVLDVCHRQTVFALGKLAALVTRLVGSGPDPEARQLAAEVVQHFSTTAREHHEDEERHVFPGLLDSADPDVVQAVLRLRQDHGWIEEDWRALSPHLAAVANGHTGYDLDLLRDGAAVFTALSHDHIALEESIVYPQARANLPARERSAMADEMAARRRARQGRDEARSSSHRPTSDGPSTTP